MPKIDLTYPAGALDADAKAELPGKLAAALLRAERAPDTEFFRSISWTHVHELPADAVHTADGQAEKPQFIVEVTTPEGALSDRRRGEMAADATDLIVEAAGLAEEDKLNVWVLMREINEGSWAAAGNVIQFEQLKAAAKAQREGEAVTSI
jgi:phenylpyruvate tautomerase PptA (4-oxalocrotonate tautomerase family)